MTQEQTPSTQQKVIASCIVVVVVALLALAASTVTKKDIGVPQSVAPKATTTTSSNAPGTVPNAAAYKDGTYTADSSYRTPGGTESITVQLTVKNGAITDTTIDQQANNRESAEYQAAFKEGYTSYVVGKALDSIYVSHVSGSSLTSQGFNNALEQIKSRAKA